MHGALWITMSIETPARKCPTCCQTIDEKLLDDVTNYQTKNESILKDKVEIPYHSLFMPWVDQPDEYLQLRVIDKETGKEALKRPLFLMHVTVVRVLDHDQRLLEIEPLADSPNGANFLASGLTGWEMMRFFFLSRTQVEGKEGVQRPSGLCDGRGYGFPFDAWWFKFDKNPMRRVTYTSLAMTVAENCPFFGTDLKEIPTMDIESDQKAIIGYEYYDGEPLIKLIRAIPATRYDEIKGQLRKYKYGDIKQLCLLE